MSLQRKRRALAKRHRYGHRTRAPATSIDTGVGTTGRRTSMGASAQPILPALGLRCRLPVVRLVLGGGVSS